MRQEPEEIAERIVWGVEEQFVSETTQFLVDRLTSLPYSDYRLEYVVERMARENPQLLNQIYLEYKDRISEEVAQVLTPYLKDQDTERAMQEFSGHYQVSKPYSVAIARLTAATVQGCTEIIARQNVAMIEEQANVWYEVASKAVTRENATMMRESEIIADAVRELSQNQITTIDYKSGVHNKIDVAIRRHIVTQVNQNYQRMNELRAQEYDWDLFMCSAHPASRPEHYPLQSEIYSRGQYIGQSIDGHTVRDYEEMEIGSVTGIYGANCAHYTTPYIPGLSQLQEVPYSAEENAKRYELTQKQRYYEREIRATKTEIADLRRAGQDDTQERLRLGRQQAKIRELCDKNGLTRERQREKAYGIGEQPRALGGTKRKTQPIPKPTPKYEVFKPFETQAQAREYVSQFVDTSAYKARFDIGKMDVSNANGLAKALHDVSQRYEFELHSIQPMNFRSNMFKGSNADAAYQWFTHDLFFNPNYLKSASAFQKHVQEGLEAQEYLLGNIEQLKAKSGISKAQERFIRGLEKSGRGGVSTSVEGIFLHELGHMLDDQVLRRAFKEYGFDVSASMEKYASRISAYSTSDNREYVAESFAAYMLGESERLDPALVSIFNKVEKK